MRTTRCLWCAHLCATTRTSAKDTACAGSKVSRFIFLHFSFLNLFIFFLSSLISLSLLTVILAGNSSPNSASTSPPPSPGESLRGCNQGEEWVVEQGWGQGCGSAFRAGVLGCRLRAEGGRVEPGPFPLLFQPFFLGVPSPKGSPIGSDSKESAGNAGDPV